MWSARKLSAPFSLRRFGVVLLLAAAMFVATASVAEDMSTASTAPPGAGQPPVGTAPSDYELGPGDRVKIVVYGQPDLSGQFHLDGAGKISMPLINAIDANGLSATALEQRIKERLKPGYLKDPNVSVEVLTYRPFYIVGEVRAPGSYPYVNGMTAINAVALAGGFTYRADEDDFEIKRGREGETVELEASPETGIRPGDVIRINERWF
ncbi:polysaccharide biosynthesis/export family protein [Parvibaculum sp.]|uniref:polysaccharide biosynthesis/export family protein n=1 Tax=Parvibaculum sp. TaxID=2024848 RepID=UPI0034A0181A